MFKINAISKTATEDSYTEGEIGKSEFTVWYIDISGKSLRELAERFVTACGAELGDIDTESGNLEVCVHEDVYGNYATARDLDGWQNGRTKLWTVRYSAVVEHCVQLDLRDLSI